MRHSSPRRASTATVRRTHGKRDTRARRHHPEHRPHIVERKTAAPASNSYSKALRYLNSLADFERLRIVRYNSQNFDLERMRTLLKRLGNPHDRFKSVHIAGTKGKGSTCAMIAAMLQGCGYKVGLYTSPHLTDVRERIQINGEMIPQAEFGRLARLAEPIIERLKPRPT
jgi:dihydrofolate synthase/folylpolyglutamate synthase